MDTEMADAVDIKMQAHDVAVDALGNVHRAVRGEIDRLSRFEQENAAHRQGGALHPVRSVLVVLRQVQRMLDPVVRQVGRRARNFEGSNYEVEGTADLDGR